MFGKGIQGGDKGAGEEGGQIFEMKKCVRAINTSGHLNVGDEGVVEGDVGKSAGKPAVKTGVVAPD